jgi:hypothetical protein
MKTTEADLARVVVEWMTYRGFDVYQEVELVARGIRADIVARRGPELTIVETKTSASLALVAQVMERRRFAHRVYIAAPSVRSVIPICEEVGIGALSVHVGDESTYAWNAPAFRVTHAWNDPAFSLTGTGHPVHNPVYINPSEVREHVPSRRWNSRPLKLAAMLRPEHKTACSAGSPTGGHWSRWRDTCAQLARVVAADPGMRVAYAITKIRHHYVSAKSARSSLLRDIERGVIPGVRVENGLLWPVAVVEGGRGSEEPE